MANKEWPLNKVVGAQITRGLITTQSWITLFPLRWNWKGKWYCAGPFRGMRSRAQALRVPVDKSGMIAHHPLRFHHSFQLLVCRSLNYRVWPVLKINVRVTKMRTNGVFLRSLSNYEEEGLKRIRIKKRFKKLWKVRIHILAWTLSTQEEKLPKSFQKI